jgi:hypothetical protein
MHLQMQRGQKENSMAKRNRGTVSADLLERSADRIGEALGTAVRTMEDLGGRAAQAASDLRGRAEAVVQKARPTTRRLKASGRTRRGTRTVAARRGKSSKRTGRKKR